MKQITVAGYIASRLADFGVRYVFGVPGGPSIPYMEAFRSAGIDFILTSHESSAAVMADVMARLTGVPGVCHSTFGPGATNISTGIGGAYLDRSPVIVLTSEMPDALIHRTVQMNIDHQQLFRSITSETFRLNPDNVCEVINDAVRICFREYPGPVHIGLPSDIADREFTGSHTQFVDAEITESDMDVARIISLLEKSRHPLLAIGLTAARFCLRKRLQDFLDKYRIPVVLTPMAKGLVNHDHPCYAGVLFHALSDYLEGIIEKTDLVIGLGYDPVEYNYESWIPDVPVVHLDTRITDMPDDHDIVQYRGMPEEWFRILGNLNAGSLVFESGVIKGIRDEMTSVFNGFLGHFGPVTVLNILRDILPADTILTFDVGSHLHLAGQYWFPDSPEKMIITNGWSSMGFGVSAAISAKIAMPGSTVVCVTGDGGFLMACGEIITARRLNLPIIFLVLSDGELNLIKLKQGWKGLYPYATGIISENLFGSDTFLGVKVYNVDTDEKLRSSIEKSLSLKELSIINAVIDPEDYKWLVVRQK